MRFIPYGKDYVVLLRSVNALVTISFLVCVATPSCSPLSSVPGHSFSRQQSQRRRARLLESTNNDDHRRALEKAGFLIINTDNQSNGEDLDDVDAVYRFNRATGMLQLVSSSASSSSSSFSSSSNNPLPTWIPLDDPQENLLVSKGWSFLDMDDSEPQSSFDIDAANVEGTYQPKWGRPHANNEKWTLSTLGWDVTPWSEEQVLQSAEKRLSTELARRVLLHGATEPPRTKQTNNGYVLAGATSELPHGIFTCALTGVPLFTTADLLPTTASSGWLSFASTICSNPTNNIHRGHSNGHPEHIRHISPADDSMDRRIEVVETKSECHLGHWFPGDGYCINACCLDFIPLDSDSADRDCFRGPASYQSFHNLAERERDNPSVRLLAQSVQQHAASASTEIVLGFWHVEAALRRLPGVLDTSVGYAGGQSSNPTYEQVCNREQPSGHAEVVRVVFDPTVLSIGQLVDCFLAMHDPTKVRAHGKHEPLKGQYRSCIFVSTPAHLPIIQEAISECQSSLGKEVCTQISINVPFWIAEDRHQRYEERRDDNASQTDTLSLIDWLRRYGKRAKSVVGTAFTLEESIAESRFQI